MILRGAYPRYLIDDFVRLDIGGFFGKNFAQTPLTAGNICTDANR